MRRARPRRIIVPFWQTPRMVVWQFKDACSAATTSPEPAPLVHDDTDQHRTRTARRSINAMILHERLLALRDRRIQRIARRSRTCVRVRNCARGALQAQESSYFWPETDAFAGGRPSRGQKLMLASEKFAGILLADAAKWRRLVEESRLAPLRAPERGLAPTTTGCPMPGGFASISAKASRPGSVPRGRVAADPCGGRTASWVRWCECRDGRPSTRRSLPQNRRIVGVRDWTRRHRWNGAASS